jgi:hypothetical protein
MQHDVDFDLDSDGAEAVGTQDRELSQLAV